MFAFIAIVVLISFSIVSFLSGEERKIIKQGNELLEAGKYHEALNAYSKIDSLNDNSPAEKKLKATAYCKMAIIHTVLENNQEAYSFFVKAIKKYPAVKLNIEKKEAKSLFMRAKTEYFLPMLASNNIEERKIAVEELSTIGWQPNSDQEKLNYLIAQGSYYEVGLLGSVSVDPLVKEFHRTKENNIKYNICEGLLISGDQKAIDLADEYIENTFIKRDGHLPPDKVQELIRKLRQGKHLKDDVISLSDYETRDAIYELGELGDKRAVVPLIASLRDKDYSHWRLEIASELGAMGDKRAVEPLVAVLNDEDKYVRFEVAGALAKMGDKRALEPLESIVDAQEHRRGFVEENIIGNVVEILEILAKKGDKRAVEQLVATLNDKSKRIRIKAAEALAQMGNKHIIEPLVAALRTSKIKQLFLY